MAIDKAGKKYKYINNKPYSIVGWKNPRTLQKEDIVAGQVVEGSEYASLIHPRMLSVYQGNRPAGLMKDIKDIEALTKNVKKNKVMMDSFPKDTGIKAPENITPSTSNSFLAKTTEQWIKDGQDPDNLKQYNKGQLQQLASFFGMRTEDTMSKNQLVTTMNNYFIHTSNEGGDDNS